MSYQPGEFGAIRDVLSPAALRARASSRQRGTTLSERLRAARRHGPAKPVQGSIRGRLTPGLRLQPPGMGLPTSEVLPPAPPPATPVVIDSAMDVMPATVTPVATASTAEPAPGVVDEGAPEPATVAAPKPAGTSPLLVAGGVVLGLMLLRR